MLNNEASPWSTTASAKPLAVLIEPQMDLAELVQSILEELGFDVVVAATHERAAWAIQSRCPQLLVAVVPPHGTHADEAFLGEWRETLGYLPTVVLQADRRVDARWLPRGAMRLLKPFSRSELMLAVDSALAFADLEHMPVEPSWQSACRA
jgi:DNA-binding response OmpR family regulator